MSPKCQLFLWGTNKKFGKHRRKNSIRGGLMVIDRGDGTVMADLGCSWLLIELLTDVASRPILRPPKQRGLEHIN